MFPRALRIVRVAGIDIRLDPSWIVIAGLVVWTFHTRFEAMGRSTSLALTMAVTGGVLFFVSVLAHELGHALEAIHRDIEVSAITLFLFGGVTEMHLEAQRPRDELVIAGVGPYVSLVAACLFGLVATFLPPGGPAGLQAVADVAGVLGWINLALALFNLVPGAPLDGGRIFRAGVWWLTKDRNRAIRISARAGQLVAALLALLALRFLFLPPSSLADGLWFGLIGAFMWMAARSELHHAETEELLGDRRVGDLVTTAAPAVGVGTPLSQAVTSLAGSPGFDAFPVTDSGGSVVGALRVDDVMAVDPHDRAFRTTDEVMLPVADLAVVTPDTPLRELLRELDRHPVVALEQHGRVGALLTTRQVGAALERLHALVRGHRRRRSQ